MRSGTLSFLMGVLVLQLHAVLPSVFICLVMLPLLIVVVRYKHPVLLLFLFFLSGYCWALVYAQFHLQQHLAKELVGKDILVTGYVTGLPANKQRSISFEFNIEQLTNNDRSVISPGYVKLSWFGDAIPEVNPGDQWQLVVRLKPPHGFMNPGVFDYEKWLFQKGIRATGYVRRSEHNKLLAVSSNPFNPHRHRLSITHHLDRLLAGQEHAPLLKALTVGERKTMSVKQWQVLRDTGTAHLMAISGLHIGLVAAMAFWLGRWSWSLAGSLYTGLCLQLPAQKVGALCAVICALTYALLAGWSIPTQRALIMVLVVMSGMLFYRHYSTSRVLSIAMLAVLIYDPLSVLAAGFWLSFAAVSVIAFVLTGRRYVSNVEKLFNVRQWGRVQWAVSLGLLPLMMLLFQQVSLVSPLANLWAIPLVSFVVVPLTLLSVIFVYIYEPLANGLLWLVVKVMDLIWLGLELMADWPWSVWKSAAPTLPVVIIAMLGIVLLLMPRGWPHRSIGLLLLLPVLIVDTDRPGFAEADVSLLDVGQGLSVVIQTKQHVLVFDSGPRYSERFDTGELVVLPFLRHENIDNIDTLLISHADNDHSGGTESIIEQVKVGQILTSSEQLAARYRDKNGLRTGYCLADQRWQWDGVQFEMLHPANALTTGHDGKGQTNNHSCVLRVNAGNQSVLITADIEKDAERKLVEKYGEQLESDILIVPHHGSRTSSSSVFLDYVRPKRALLPVGYRNRYRLPSKTVMMRYQQRSIPVDSTSISGALQFRLINDQIPAIREYRKQARRYWHHLPVSD